mgnify:CR=1 FL=1
MGAYDIEPALRRSLCSFFWNDTYCVRPNAKRNIKHLLSRRHFKIQRLGDCLFEAPHICVGDMTPIFAQMRGDAIGSGIYGKKSRAQRVRTGTTPRITNSRNMININPKPQI